MPVNIFKGYWKNKREGLLNKIKEGMRKEG